MPAELDEAQIAGVAGALAAVVMVVSELNANKYEPTGVRDRSKDTRRGRNWVAECLADPRQLYVDTRLKPYCFYSLVDYLRSHELVNDSMVSVEEKLLNFLYVCGHGGSWRNTKYRCGHSLETISRSVII